MGGGVCGIGKFVTEASRLNRFEIEGFVTASFISFDGGGKVDEGGGVAIARLGGGGVGACGVTGGAGGTTCEDSIFLDFSVRTTV